MNERERAGERPTDEDGAPRSTQEPRAWWDISGIELPGADYQPLAERMTAGPGADAENAAGEPAGAGADLAERAALPSSTGGIVSALHTVAEPVATVIGTVAEPVASAIGNVIGAANDALTGGVRARARRLRHLNRAPLANLYELHPEAREASPRELGLRFIPVDEIRGTAVAGIAQRGSDYLPLRPFRGANWEARWARIRRAFEHLESLPPVDLVKFGGEYWVLDGHNRVAAALYGNGTGLDAMVTELVPLDGQASERGTGLLPLLGDTAALRAAAEGLPPAIGLRQAELAAEGPADATASDDPGREGGPGTAAQHCEAGASDERSGTGPDGDTGMARRQ